MGVTEVANKLGIPRTTYGNFENETEPDVATIKLIAEALGVHYVEIIDGPGAKVPEIPQAEDYEVEVKMKRSDIEMLRFSLNELGRVFQRAFQLETEKPLDHPSGNPVSDNIKPRRMKGKKPTKRDNV